MTKPVGASQLFKTEADRWLAELDTGPPDENPFALADAITQAFPEINSVSPNNQSIPFSPSLTFAGTNNSFRNNQVNAVGKIYPQLGVDAFPDSLNLILDLALQANPGPTDELEFDIFAAGLDLGQILGTGGEGSAAHLISVGSFVQGEFFRALLTLDTSAIVNGPELVAVGIIRDATGGNIADTFSGNVTLIGMSLILPRPGTF